MGLGGGGVQGGWTGLTAASRWKCKLHKSQHAVTKRGEKRRRDLSFYVKEKGGVNYQ